ncbi:MAG: hypothetical protein P1P58_03975 [Treponema sp.]
MKKIVVSVYAVLFIISSATCKTKYDVLEGLSIQEINFNNYYRENWNEVVKDNTELYVYYKAALFQNCEYIAELYYVLVNARNEKKILGGFSKKRGFFDATGDNFTSVSDEDFMKNQLIGLSIETLEHPFIINGFALSSDNDVYTTEVMMMLIIDAKNMTIKEWFPEL